MIFREAVIATSNPGKLLEFRSILGELSIPLKSAASYSGVTFPEEGENYEANAIAKARVVSKAGRCLALADDSGLEVRGLDGGPGPRSARYGGVGLNDSERVARLLAALTDVDAMGRRARFVCVAALALPDGSVVTATGDCEGVILSMPRGSGGFGYDSIFGLADGERSMAELSTSEKNRISHRARALKKLLPKIKEYVFSHRQCSRP